MVKVPSNIPRDLVKTTKALTEGSGTVSAEWDEPDWSPVPIVDDTSNDELPDPTRVYYTLPDFAAKWGKTASAILQMAAVGALELSVRCSGHVYDPDKPWKLKHVAGYAQLGKHQALLILDHGKTGKVSDIIDRQPVIFEGKVVSFLKNDELPQELQMPPELQHVRSLRLNCIDDLLILPTEAARVVKKYPELFNQEEGAIRSEIEAIKGGQPAPQIVPQKQAPPVNNTENKGGAKPGYLREAVKHLFDKFRSEGNTEILQSGKIDEFITRLKESVTEGNRNFSDYVAQRILLVKKRGNGWEIKTQERAIPGEKYVPSRIYSKGDVSKILTSLRSNN